MQSMMGDVRKTVLINNNLGLFFLNEDSFEKVIGNCSRLNSKRRTRGNRKSMVGHHYLPLPVPRQDGGLDQLREQLFSY